MSKKPTTPRVPAGAAPWRPLPEAWDAFGESYPELFVGRAASTRSRFCGRHGPALTAAGALLKTPGGAYYAHAEKFAPMAYALALGLPLAEPERQAA